MKIAIVNYQAGNLRNVQKSIESLNITADIAVAPEDLRSSDGIVLPGVGSFHQGMSALNEAGLAESLRVEVLERSKPIVGICLGLHLLAEKGIEGGESEGLGLLPMSVVKFAFENAMLRVPHVGWNSVYPKSNTSLFAGVPPGADFYFAHSYHVECDDESIITATCDYGYDFGVAVERKHVFGTQFHPEKSQRYGRLVLRNFLEYCNSYRN